MSDAIMVFRGRPPRSVMVKGEQWDFLAGPVGVRERRGRIWFHQPQTDREILLWEGPPAETDDAIARGLLVKSGTPARGLATALRRLGVVDLLPAPAVRR
jgi:hypothetical protein